MLFSELHKIMVNKVTFLGFRGGSPQSPPSDPLLLCVSFNKSTPHNMRASVTLRNADAWQENDQCMLRKMRYRDMYHGLLVPTRNLLIESHMHCASQ